MAVIVLIFFFILRSFFFRPILKVMAQREANTRGAQRAAQGMETAAAEKAKQYEEALKHAKAKVYLEQEAERKKLLDERAATLKEERAKVAGEVGIAKERVARELAEAAKEVELTAVDLAKDIARRVLLMPPAPGSPAREAR